MSLQEAGKAGSGLPEHTLNVDAVTAQKAVEAVCVLVIQLFLILCDLHGLYPARLLCPLDSPGVETNEFIYHLFKQSITFR